MPFRPRRCGSISSPTPATSCAPRCRPCSAMPRRWPRKHDLPADLRSKFGAHHPRRSAADAAHHRGSDELVADRGRPLPRAGRERRSRRGHRDRDRQRGAACAAAGNASSSSMSPRTCPPVRGDRAQLVQVLDNLISNAVRYGCDGPGAKVEVSAKFRRAAGSALTVTDHGPGIAREHLPRVTERFYRVDAARSREVRRDRPWSRNRQAYRRAPQWHARDQEHGRGRHERQRPPAGRRAKRLAGSSRSASACSTCSIV